MFHVVKFIAGAYDLNTFGSVLDPAQRDVEQAVLLLSLRPWLRFLCAGINFLAPLDHLGKTDRHLIVILL